MIFTLSVLFTCASLGFLLILILGALRFIYRGKYAEAISRIPTAARDRLAKTDKALVKLFRIFLWVAPIYLIFIPLGLFYYEREIFGVATVCIALMLGAASQEYFFRKWLIKYIEAKDALHTQPP